MILLEAPRYWYAGSLGLSLGILWRWFSDKIMVVLSSNNLSLIIFIMAFSLWGLFSKYIGFKEFHPFFTSVIMVVLVHRFPFRCPKRIVQFFAAISFEIYLFQAISMAIVFTLCGVALTWVGMCFVMFLDVCVSYFFHYYVINPIIKMIEK